MATKDRHAAHLTQAYCRAFRRAMAPLPQLRRRALRDMHASLEEYLARNPAADADALNAAFGTPEQAAENILNGMDAGQILAEARRYSWRRLAAIVVIALAWAGLALCCGLSLVQVATQPALTAARTAAEIDSIRQSFPDGSSIEVQTFRGDPDPETQTVTAHKRYACYEAGTLVWVYTLHAEFVRNADGKNGVMAQDRVVIFDEDWVCDEHRPGARNDDEAFATAIFRRQSDGRQVYPSLSLVRQGDGTIR